MKSSLPGLCPALASWSQAGWSETRQRPPHHRPPTSRELDLWGETRRRPPPPSLPIPREIDRWSSTRHTRTPEIETPIEVCRITAHTLLEGLLGGARQDGIHCITVHPLLERVSGGVRPDITAHECVTSIVEHDERSGTWVSHRHAPRVLRPRARACAARAPKAGV